MGNLVSTTSGSYGLDENGVGNAIKNIFANKNEFKKRSCCRAHNGIPGNVTISLPTITDDNGNINSDGTKIKSQTISIPGVPVASCSIATSSTSGSINFLRADNTSNNPQCTGFYQDFCDNVFNNRDASYTAPNDKYYGPYYRNTPATSPTKTTNIYEDCNCLNNQYFRDPIILNALQISNTAGIDPEVMAQNADTQCTGNISSLVSYIESNNVKPQFCANFIAVQNSTLINSVPSQTCNTGGTAGAAPAADPAAAPAAPPTTPTTPPPPPAINKTMIIVF